MATSQKDFRAVTNPPQTIRQDARDRLGGDPSVARLRLGEELKRLRLASGLRLQDVAAKLDLAPSSLSRLEKGRHPVKDIYLRTLFDLYGLGDGQRQEMLAMAKRTRSTTWWHQYRDLLPGEAGRYLSLETAACQVASYSATVPGLLQTPDYAAAAVAAARPGLTGREVRQLVALQLRRQDIVRASGCRLDLLVDESALLRDVCPGQVMAAQIQHLLGASADPRVTVRIVSLRPAKPVLAYPFTILSFASPADAPVVCHPANHWVHISANTAAVENAQRIHAALAANAAQPSRRLSLRLLAEHGLEGQAAGG
jgi:transcriptional regulator with XRE-family HTH domain